MPLIAAMTASPPAQSRYSPVCPKSVIDTITSAGLRASATSGAGPGVPVSIQMSAVSSSASRRSPSTVTPRLFALRRLLARAPPAGATRITSAPRSARKRAHVSPLPSAPSTTRTPESRASGSAGRQSVLDMTSGRRRVQRRDVQVEQPRGVEAEDVALRLLAQERQVEEDARQVEVPVRPV